MKKFWQFILIILVFLSLVALAIRFGSEPARQVLGLEGRSGIRIDSVPASKVFINGLEKGETPYESDQMEPGIALIELKPSSSGSSQAGSAGSPQVQGWIGNVPLNNGTITVVNREIALSEATSSGEVISLESGKGAMIISNPSEAVVTIDGVEAGRTPLSVNIEPGEHVFTIEKLSYLTRSIKANLLERQKLVINADLSLSEADLTRIEPRPLLEIARVEVLPTSTGFLRVRQGPSVGSLEIGRVEPGAELDVMDQAGSWYKVRLEDGKEGYISASFVKKVN